MSDIKGEKLTWFLDELASSEAYQFEDGEIEIVVCDKYDNEDVTTVSVQDLAGSAVKELNTMQARIVELEGVIREADDYLNINSMTSIGSGSVLHAKFKQALKDNS